MRRERYEEYVRRFNAQDPTAFDEFIHPDMRMLNGALEFRGVQGMREHYCQRIWPHFQETLHIERFVSDEGTLAVQLWTRFVARVDAVNTLFGPVKAGERFDYRGIVMYELEQGKFTRITVAYNSFTHTGLGGETRELGLPH
jgi:predicted ester cyclase